MKISIEKHKEENSYRYNIWDEHCNKIGEIYFRHGTGKYAVLLNSNIFFNSEDLRVISEKLSKLKL
jgi:hypothetical protein